MSNYILDTDHFSLWQRNHPLVIQHIQNVDPNVLAITIITAEELIRGRFNVIRESSQVSHSEKLILAYTKLWETLALIKHINIINFDHNAYRIYAELRHQKIRIGTQDLKIASIAMANNAILITRNYRDFSKVPNLALTDWTISEMNAEIN